MLDLIIISGGQTGTDQAALRAAHAAGLQTSGWAAHGFLIKSDDGRHDVAAPWLGTDYGLSECAKPGYPARTQANILDSDATLLMVLGQRGCNSRGSVLAIKTAERIGRPILPIDVQAWRPHQDTTARDVAHWIKMADIRRLNCAGNRDRAIEPLVERFLGEVFRILRGDPASAISVGGGRD